MFYSKSSLWFLINLWNTVEFRNILNAYSFSITYPNGHTANAIYDFHGNGIFVQPRFATFGQFSYCSVHNI